MKISVPDGLQGKKTDAIKEFIDIYPTLIDLLGSEIPNSVEGKSLAPIVSNSELD